MNRRSMTVMWLLVLLLSAGCKEKAADAPKTAETKAETKAETAAETESEPAEEDPKLKEYGFAAIPESSTNFPGWDFDLQRQKKQAEIESQIVYDSEGNSRLITDEYRKNPVEENLTPVNPTIRWQNGEGEDFAIACMNNAGYPEIKNTKAFYKALELEPSERLKLRIWQLEKQVYFYITADFSGAWNMRSYGFIHNNGKTLQNICYQYGFPQDNEALTVRGAIHGDAAAINNLAVMMLNRELRHNEIDEVELLKQSAAAGCRAAERNLCLYYLRKGKFDEARQLAPRVTRIPPIPDRPSVLDYRIRDAYLKTGEKLLKAGKYAQARPYLERVALDENDKGLFLLGQLLEAIGDKAQAAEKYRKSEKYEAKSRLAKMKFAGDGIPQDGPGAAEILKETAMNPKNLTDRKLLGEILFFGLNGVPRDREQGCRYLLMTCIDANKEYNADEMNEDVYWAMLERNGDLFFSSPKPKTFQKIIPYAEKGDVYAMELLADYYGTGITLPTPDHAQARKWAQRLAAARPSPGNRWRCFLVFAGSEKPADRKRAEVWLRRAADSKHPEALAFLGGILLERGEWSEAGKYLDDAANTTELGRKFREELRRQEKR